MVRYFFDTSALVKHYHVEAGTRVVDGLFADVDTELFISRLAVVEVASALSLKVRAGEITPAQMGAAHRGFHTDISLGRLAVVRILVQHFRDAEGLLLSYATSQRLRTLDALQVAVALDLWRNNRIEKFVVADTVLADVSAREGLPALNVLVTTS